MEGRDERGRFAVGNPGGPGRPRRQTEAAYLQALSEACPPERWARICEKVAALAESGDLRAIAWLSKHLLGDRTVGKAYPLTETDQLRELLQYLDGDADDGD